MRLIVASNNQNKIREIKKILQNKVEEVISLKDAGIFVDVEETGKTFQENALLKATAIRNLLKDKSFAVLADDSGLEVEALNGAPGIFSARFAGENKNDSDNRKKLLTLLKNQKNRKARFVCALVLINENDGKISVTATSDGEITEKERGDNGFGYDSLFYSYDLKKTFAEASDDEKNSVSHRARALLQLQKKL